MEPLLDGASLDFVQKVFLETTSFPAFYPGSATGVMVSDVL
jgi:hypothetical protein